jgi:hypothetical protein
MAKSPVLTEEMGPVPGPRCGQDTDEEPGDDDLEPGPVSCAVRWARACHSTAISTHASLVAGSVAFRANPSQASALCRYFSATLIIVMLHMMAGAQRSLSPITTQKLR